MKFGGTKWEVCGDIMSSKLECGKRSGNTAFLAVCPSLLMMEKPSKMLLPDRLRATLHFIIDVLLEMIGDGMWKCEIEVRRGNVRCDCETLVR